MQFAGTTKLHRKSGFGLSQLRNRYRKTMKAAILISGRTAPESFNQSPFLQIEEVPRPEPQPGYVLLRVLACGVCRTDLHIAEGDLPPVRQQLIPGHQIVGEVAGGAA